MTRTGLEEELRVAVDAVRQASELCRSVARTFEPAHATAKADHSPVTVADLGSQALISMALAEAFPDDPVMGEEDASALRASRNGIATAVLDQLRALGRHVDLERTAWALDRCGDRVPGRRRHWTLDPVDGTKGFLRREQYAVALALIEDGEPVLGVLGCPNLAADPHDPGAGLGCLFVARRGHGARQLPLDGSQREARPIHVTGSTDLPRLRCIESVEPRHSALAEGARVAHELGIATPPLRMDSQVKYAVVARGEAAIYLRLPHPGYVENVWDHAAGWLLVLEAGGSVSDADGRDLDFTCGRKLESNRGIVATPAGIHETVLGAVRRVLDA